MFERIVSILEPAPARSGQPVPGYGAPADLPLDLSTARTAAWLAGLLTAALAARVYVCFLAGLAVQSTDTFSYFEMADAIAKGAPMSYFPNGYPLIVAAVKVAVGDARLVPVLLLLHVLMSTAVVVASFAIARRLTTRRVALLATALVAFWPNQLNYTRQLITEVPSAFFLTLALAAALAARPLSSGLLFAAATVTRSSLFPAGPLVAACLFVGRRRLPAGLLVAGFVFGLALELVLVRLGVIQSASNFGSNLVIAVGSTSGQGVDYSARVFSDQEKAQPVLTYLTFAAHHPADFLWQRFSALWELWGPWPNAGDAGAPRSTATRLAIGLRFPALLLAIVAFWVGRRRLEIWCVAMPILAVTVVHTVFFSTARFTFPAEPPLLVLAALGAAEIARALGLRRPVARRINS